MHLHDGEVASGRVGVARRNRRAQLSLSLSLSLYLFLTLSYPPGGKALDPHARVLPLSSEHATYKTVQARFWRHLHDSEVAFRGVGVARRDRRAQRGVVGLVPRIQGSGFKV